MQDPPQVKEGFTDRATPRRAVWSLLWWLQESPEQWRPDLAAQCLDLSRADRSEGETLAIQLKRWMDAKGLYVNPKAIPDEADFEHPNKKERKFWISSDDAFRKLYLVKVEEVWLFSAETVASVPSWYRAEFPSVLDFVFDHLPPGFRWEIPWLGIRLWQAAGIGIALLLAYFASVLVRWMLSKPIRSAVARYGKPWAEGLLRAIGKPLGALAGLGLFSSLFPLLLIAPWNHAFEKMAAPCAVLLAIWLLWRLGSFFAEELKIRAQRTKEQTDDHLVPFVRIGARVAVVTLGAILFLQSLGLDVGTLVAGLGIGGLAVALALQSVLGDLFASVAIAMDKPFLIGDFIVFGNFAGTVESVGLKTTRVRSLTGEQLILSNADLVKSTLRNFKRMQERRVVFSVGLVYQTLQDTLERIPRILREIVESTPNTRFDRAHFIRFGDSALEFEIVYWVSSPDYNIYMDAQQKIHLEIVKRFAAEGIEFAYPTRTIFVEGLPVAGGRS